MTMQFSETSGHMATNFGMWRHSCKLVQVSADVILLLISPLSDFTIRCFQKPNNLKFSSLCTKYLDFWHFLYLQKVLSQLWSKFMALLLILLDSFLKEET